MGCAKRLAANRVEERGVRRFANSRCERVRGFPTMAGTVCAVAANQIISGRANLRVSRAPVFGSAGTRPHGSISRVDRNPIAIPLHDAKKPNL